VADLDEAAALAWLCEHLPRFRRAAGNRTQLESVVENVRERRKTAVWAYRQLGGPTEVNMARSGDSFGVPFSLFMLNMDPPIITGGYECPHHRCSRAGRADDDGREPVCHLGTSPAPMQFYSNA
jgi:hypothetical protein